MPSDSDSWRDRKRQYTAALQLDEMESQSSEVLLDQIRSHLNNLGNCEMV